MLRRDCFCELQLLATDSQRILDVESNEKRMPGELKGCLLSRKQLEHVGTLSYVRMILGCGVEEQHILAPKS